MINLKKRSTTEAVSVNPHPARLQEAYFAALSDVIFGEDLGKSVDSILAGIGRAFNAEVFLFRRSGNSAELTGYLSKRAKEIAELMRKAGIRVSPKKIPLPGGREKLFESPFIEYDDLFHLIGDMTTSAACRKIQGQLAFRWLASVSVKAESNQFVLLMLIAEKPQTLRQDLERFSFLLKAAYYLSGVRERLRQLESRFDEQLLKVKNEMREKENGHLYLFNEMTIAAAVLDDRGVITEANDALRNLVGTEPDPVSQSFSSLIEEEERGEFTQFLVGVGAGENATTAVSISGRHFKAYVVTRKKADGERGISVVYLADDTADVELQDGLGRTIDALRSEKELAERLASEAREYSENIIRDSAVPTMVVADGMIKVTSNSAGKVFDLGEGEQFDQFLARNGLTQPEEGDPVSEISDSKGRVFSVARWKIGGDDFFVFDDITEFRRMEEELARSTVESEKLFNGFLPTALVTGGNISKRNDMFESLFGEFLSSDGSFDGFLRYLGESPEAFTAELRSGGIIMRMCRTTDRKYLNVSAATAGDMIFLFMEDITEQENLKLQLRDAQGLLNSLLESFSEDPVFIAENGVTRAANVAARNKLSIMLDEHIEPARLLESVGIMRSDDTGEINGQFYKVENTTIGSAEVYRFKQTNQEVAQRAEMERLKRRQEILRDLSAVDRFEAILQSLSDLLKTDGRAGAKVVGTGTLQVGRGTADVYLMTMATGKIEPSLSLSLTESDTTTVDHGGAMSGIEVPDTTFMNVIASGDSRLVVQSTAVGDTKGFASVALPPTGVPPEYVEELGRVLRAASSVAAGLYARTSAVRKFEDSGKVTRATVGLTGMGEGPFEDVSRRSIDLLRQVFAAESVGIYSIEGPAMAKLLSNGSLPDSLSVPGVKFGAFTPSGQLESQEMTGAEGVYFAVRSRTQKLALLFRFLGVPPSPSELNAVSSVSLDILESRRSADEQGRTTAGLVANSKAMSDFMSGLSRAATPDDVVKTLQNSLVPRMSDASVAIEKEKSTSPGSPPLEVVEKEDGEYSVYEADLTTAGWGTLKVRCAKDQLSRTMVGLAVDKMRSIFAMKLPAVQSEAASLRGRLDRAKEEYEELRQSIEKVPASLRNARIGIDNVLSRLSFVQGDEKVIQEIKLHLASAAKEMSMDLDRSSRDQNQLFEAVRSALLEASASAQDPAATKFRGFDTSAMTEFRTDQATFDLLRDIFSNFVLVSGVEDCDILMTTAQPGPGETAEGKGKRVSLRIRGREGETLSGDAVSGSASLRALTEKIEKLGYGLDANVFGNEMTLDVFEVRIVESPAEGALSAILVEDDKLLVEEESQNLLQIFSRLKVAGDAVEAAKIFEVEKFGAAFIDLSLPSINGRELCSQIKKVQPGCITVLLTNREGEEKSEGVDHIALRPLEEREIRAYISKQ